jgi:hypothetical protein
MIESGKQFRIRDSNGSRKNASKLVSRERASEILQLQLDEDVDVVDIDHNDDDVTQAAADAHAAAAEKQERRRRESEQLRSDLLPVVTLKGHRHVNVSSLGAAIKAENNESDSEPDSGDAPSLPSPMHEHARAPTRVNFI